MTLTMTEPSGALCQAFMRMVEDYRDNDPEVGDYYIKEIGNFDSYIQKLKNESAGINLPPGYVPQTTFWFMTPAGDIGGISRLRHYLNDFLHTVGGHIGYDVPPGHRGKGYASDILQQTLLRAKAMGITRVLLTADQDNVASTRTVEKNGGVISSTNNDPITGKLQNLYWLDLSK